MTLTLRSSTSFINLKEITSRSTSKTSDEFSGTVNFAQIKPPFRLRLRAKQSMQETVNISNEKSSISTSSNLLLDQGKIERFHKFTGPNHHGGDGENSSRSNGSSSKVPVFVMLPLDTISIGGQLNKPRAMNASLMALKSAGVEGVMVDVWWGLVEKDGPLRYNWDGYTELVNMVKKNGLKLQAVMSFHQCGGNVGDSCR